MTDKVADKAADKSADSKDNAQPRVVKVKRYKLNPVKFFLKTTYWALLLAFVAVLLYILFQAFDTWYHHYLATKS